MEIKGHMLHKVREERRPPQGPGPSLGLHRALVMEGHANGESLARSRTPQSSAGASTVHSLLPGG